MSIDKCPNCESTNILCDLFEDNWFYWCQHCGANLTKHYEMSMEEEDESDEDSEHKTKKRVSRAKR